MKLKEDQVKIKELLKDTITLLCKNGLQYKLGFSVEALIGITLDEEDVFLVNIKESVLTDEGKSAVEVTVRKAGEEETDNESECGKTPTKKARKRPPDGHSFGDLPSPAKHLRTDHMDETSNASEMSKDSILNIKAEPDDDDELVFVKEEGTDYSSCSQPTGFMNPQQTAMISQQGFTPGHSFDSTPADSLPGLSWNPNDPQANLSGANQSFSSPRTSSQQSTNAAHFTHECESCKKRFSRKSTLKDHLRLAHGIGEALVCECGAKFMGRGALRWHWRSCAMMVNKAPGSPKNPSETSNGVEVPNAQVENCEKDRIETLREPISNPGGMTENFYGFYNQARNAANVLWIPNTNCSSNQ